MYTKKQLNDFKDLRESYCERVLELLSERKNLQLLTKVYSKGNSNYQLADLANEQVLLDYLDNTCAGQAVSYEGIYSFAGPNIVLKCPLGIIDVDALLGVEQDWRKFALGYFDGDKELVAKLRNDYHLSGMGDAMKLIRREIAWIWDMQYLPRAKLLLEKRKEQLQADFAKQLLYLPVACKKVEKELANNGRLNRALFSLMLLDYLTTYKLDTRELLIQKLQEKYQPEQVNQLKGEFLSYLRKNFAEYIELTAFIPQEPHKYQIYLCDFHNEQRYYPHYRSTIEYFYSHKREINQCTKCEVYSEENYYAIYCFKFKFVDKTYTFDIPHAVGKTWLPKIEHLPEACLARDITIINEEQLLWAYQNDLLTEIAEVME